MPCRPLPRAGRRGCDPVLTNLDHAELRALRHDLHRHPDLSRDEGATAARVGAALALHAPDLVLTGLGGHGLAAVFEGAAPGPTVMFRAELDGLPIHETGTPPHRSLTPGKGHLCGHDGHMVLLLGLARLLARRRPAKGRVVLMFQPAEEDGSGAAAVVADPAYAAIRPDWAFAIHNMPGVPLGHGWLRAGTVNCASEGLEITFSGKTAHASQPEAGLAPTAALARLMLALPALGRPEGTGADYRLVTLTHARLGEPAFGIAPGEAHLYATLRTETDATLDDLRTQAMALAERAAREAGLGLAFARHDGFAASVNDAQATAHVAAALDALGIAHGPGGLPMRASEDFGRFGSEGTRAAMLLLGAGEGHAALHNPDYDFPDDLIAPGVAIFARLARDILG